VRIVVDASVALKWFLRSPEEESDGAAALDVLRAIHEDRLVMVQPPHFIAEVSAVLAREGARFADEALRDLLEIERETVADEDIYRRAMALSRRLSHHLFDTLYHALALETPQALLVTADERYHRVARREGGIALLRDFDPNSRAAAR
jgi:predicted nucleic acid-binding protein